MKNISFIVKTILHFISFVGRLELVLVIVLRSILPV